MAGDGTQAEIILQKNNFSLCKQLKKVATNARIIFIKSN